MEYRLGICDDDCHYVVNLMDYINSYRECGVCLVAFSSIEAVEEYLSIASLDGVLVGQDIKPSEEFQNEHEGLILIPLVGEKNQGADGVYKYQSARCIAENILARLNVDIALKPISGKAFYAVYSPVGRSGKTSLAKGLGVKHRGALYIGLEEFGSRDNLGEEILYHIIFENTKLHELLDRVPSDQYGLREIKGILSYMDIRYLTRSNLAWLKEQLLMGGDYDRVVFDIGGAVLTDLNVLDTMDRIYVPVLDDEGSRIKLQAFRELLRCKEYQSLVGKLKYVNVPQCHYASEMMQEFISKGEL